MGEISNDMIRGACCSTCGQYFVKDRLLNGEMVQDIFEHSYPVACKECWEEDCGYEKARADTL